MADDNSSDSNPSTGWDLPGLMGNIIGTAGDAYIATQQAQTSQSIAQASIANSYRNPGNPLAVLSTGNGRSWLIIGAGVLALALILRR